jgi:toxin HigB-1
MIRSFKCKETQKIWEGQTSTKFPPEIQKRALQKLGIIEHAKTLDDLKVPPGNQLEKLSGDREGQWSIRINDQWRICFRWDAPNADDVEIVDYH